jgi:hypothetical protein
MMWHQFKLFGAAMSSVKKKRRLKINKHKRKKRNRRDRHKKR